MVIEGVRHTRIIPVLRRLVAPSAFVLAFLEVPDKVLRERRSLDERSGDGNWNQIETHSTEMEVTTNLKSLADLVLDASKPVATLVKEAVSFLEAN